MSYCNTPSSFGKLNPAQTAIVRHYVAGRTVFDLGAGSYELSRCLVDLGAKKVYAVERNERFGGPLEIGTPYENVQVIASGLRGLGQVARHKRRAAELPPVTHRSIDVAFISWPSNEDSKMSSYSDFSLLDPVRRAKVVIYLGYNFDGTACGSRRLYQHLAKRKVLEHEPARGNVLIVYGALLPHGKVRELLPEEHAGLDRSQIYYFRDAYSRVTAEDVLAKRSRP